MKLPILRSLVSELEDNVFPLLYTVYPAEECKGIQAEYARMENEPLSLPYVVDLRKFVSLVNTKIRLVGIDMEDEKRKAVKSLRELDLVLLAFQQFMERRAYANHASST